MKIIKKKIKGKVHIFAMLIYYQFIRCRNILAKWLSLSDLDLISLITLFLENRKSGIAYHPPPFSPQGDQGAPGPTGRDGLPGPRGEC